jgi:hypothetical protein
MIIGVGERGTENFGLRWQSAATTPLSVRQEASKSGVALRFPPQSKNVPFFASLRLCVKPFFVFENDLIMA